MSKLLSLRHSVMLPRLFKYVLLGFLSLGLALGWVGSAAMPSLAIAVVDVPNPREANGGWVTDMADLLSDEGEQQLNQIIGELEASNGAEIAVVTVLDTQPSASPKAFATELFNTWGIGKAGEDNGVLFLISKNERRTEIETGYGAEALLTDAEAGQILRNQVTPQFKQGNFEVGIVNGVGAIAEHLQPKALTTTSERDSSSDTVQPSQAEQSAAQPSGWFVPGNLWVLLMLVAYGFSQRLKLPNPLVRVAPTGRTDAVPRTWVDDIWLGVVCHLSGEDLNGGKYHVAPLRELMEQKVRKGMGWLALGITLIAVLTFAGAKQWSCLRWSSLALAWLCFEIVLSYATAVRRQGFWGTVPPIGAVFLFLLQAFCLFWSMVLGTWLLALPFSVFATLSLALRLHRQQFATPRCAVCARSRGLQAPKLEPLSLMELKPHLTSIEQFEIMRFEAYHCPVCHPASATPLAWGELHVVSNPELYKDFGHCPSCKTKAVGSKTVLAKAPTPEADGKRLTQKHCHCCGHQTEEASSVKYRTPVKRSRRRRFMGNRWGSGSGSGYSGGGYSGGGGYSDGGSSSGSSGGGSYGGGDFGGGESGGGGAGEGW